MTETTQRNETSRNLSSNPANHMWRSDVILREPMLCHENRMPCGRDRGAGRENVTEAEVLGLGRTSGSSWMLAGTVRR